MNEPFLPVSRPSLSKVERDLLMEAFDSSWISSSGRFLDEFERRFAEACGVEHALAVSNGTVALHLALDALGIGPGDEVIVPSLTYVATANAVRYCGAEPVFADVTAEDWCLDPESVVAVVGPRTRAVIAVHVYGHPADMEALRQLCDAHGLFLVEDAAEAPFAERAGRRTGSMGDVATFSFYGNKIISSGEGGAVTTNDSVLAARMRLLRGQGMDPNRRYWFPVVGHNFRLTNLAAAILCGQMQRLDDILGNRREIFRQYTDAFRGVSGIALQPVADGATLAPWLYCLILERPDRRDDLMKHLKIRGVETRPFFIPLHTMPPYIKSRTAGGLVNTRNLSAAGLNLPTFSELSADHVRDVASKVISFIKASQS